MITLEKELTAVEQFRQTMASGTHVVEGSPLFAQFHKYSQEALQITMELNNKYHTPQEVRALFSRLTGQEIDASFGLFPPFYTDCGKNIHVGKNVFINACCRFQDQGGITIGDNVLIGHNTTIATLNHDVNPYTRGNLTPRPVKIGDRVWIGSDCTILPGVTIAAGAIIGAGSVVTKDIPENCIAVGNPCKVIRKITEPARN